MYVNYAGVNVGIFCFGVAHIFYIRAFGGKHYIKTGFILYAFSLLNTTSTLEFHFNFVRKFYFLVVMTGLKVYCLHPGNTLCQNLDLKDGDCSENKFAICVLHAFP